MKRVQAIIDKFNTRVGQWASWLTTVLVLLMCYDVFMRYFFSNSKTWILELEWHLFALIFLFGASYAFKEDRHVRVDLFYTHFSEKKKAWINLIGSAVLLMPWCFIVIWKSWTYAYSSWQIAEGSPQPGGLPARYLVKGAIALAFVLLFLQGLATIYHSIQILKSSKQ